MQIPAAGSLSITQDTLEMRDTTRVSLWDELSHTDVSETQTVLWSVYPDMARQKHLQGQLQDENVQSVTIARGSPGLYWVHKANFLSGALLVRRTRQPTHAGQPTSCKCLSKVLIQPGCSHKQRLLMYRLQDQYSRAPMTPY